MIAYAVVKPLVIAFLFLKGSHALIVEGYKRVVFLLLIAVLDADGIDFPP
jgi:hypothetical protein